MDLMVTRIIYLLLKSLMGDLLLRKIEDIAFLPDIKSIKAFFLF